MKRNRDLFESSVERLARILSDRFDVKVVFRGEMCMTDGRTVYLPHVPEDAPEAQMDAIEGYLDHEVAHLIFTDFDVFGAVADPMTKLWLNILEDVRVEARMRELWRGCGRNFGKASRFVMEATKPRWPDMDEMTKLTLAACHYAKGQSDMVREFPGGEELLRDLEALKPALDKAVKMPDTLHCLSLAAWITKQMGHEKAAECRARLPKPAA